MEGLAGKEVGRYVLERQLGKGTYGQVFSATLKNSLQRFALKRIAFSPADECIQLVFREISILKSLSAPSIIELLDVVVEGAGCVWLVTRLFDSDLRVFVKQSFSDRKVPLPLVKSLMRQLASGLAYCHAQRVWHRDLKPQNVLIDWATKEIRIADFGLAKCVSSRTLPSKSPLTHEIVTLWYRAPEVILGCASYTGAIDVWSLGVIALELYAGATPFNGRSEVDTLIKIFSLVGTPTPVSCPDSVHWPNCSRLFPIWSPSNALRRIRAKAAEVPDAWHELVRAALDIDPINRPSAEGFLSLIPRDKRKLCLPAD